MDFSSQKNWDVKFINKDDNDEYKPENEASDHDDEESADNPSDDDEDDDEDDDAPVDPETEAAEASDEAESDPDRVLLKERAKWVKKVGKRSRRNFYREQKENHMRIEADNQHTYNYTDEDLASDLLPSDDEGRFALEPVDDGDQAAQGDTFKLKKVAGAGLTDQEEWWYDAKSKMLFRKKAGEDSGSFRAQKLSRAEAKKLKGEYQVGGT